MFQKKENTIEFDFNEMKVQARAVDVALAIAKGMKAFTEATSSVFDAKAMDNEVRIVKEMLKEIFGANKTNEIIQHIWGDDKPDFYDFRDLYLYVSEELNQFVKSRSNVNNA